MTDNGDGTHTYTYQVNNDGILNISVLLSNRGYVYTQYFSNIDLLGTMETFYVSNIDFDWGIGAVFGRGSEYVSVKFTSYLLPPVTGTYTFYVVQDDGATLIVGGVSTQNNQS